MGILFNILFVSPMRRFLGGRNADWQWRKDAGERVFPLKPDTVFLASLILIAVVGSLIFG